MRMARCGADTRTVRDGAGSTRVYTAVVPRDMTDVAALLLVGVGAAVALAGAVAESEGGTCTAPVAGGVDGVERVVAGVVGELQALAGDDDRCGGGGGGGVRADDRCGVRGDNLRC